MPKKSLGPFREALPDGSRLERNYRKLADGTPEGYGSWMWVVYDSTQPEKRKKLNLGTADRDLARRKATEYARERAIGAFDPHADPIRVGVTIKQAAEKYADSQERAGRAPSTVDAARRLLESFRSFLPTNCLVGQVKTRNVVDFLGAPKPNNKAKSAATKQRYAAVLRHFFGFCVKQGYAKTNPVVGVETPTVQPNRRDHLTARELAAVLRSIHAKEVLSGHSYKWLTDWLTFAAQTGLRPGEQRDLRWKDVRLGEGKLGAIQIGKDARTKTAKSARTVQLSYAAREIVESRHAARKSEADGPVFTLPRGGPVELRYLSKSIQRFGKAAEVDKNPTSYSLRHTFGTQMLSKSESVYSVARFMGTGVGMIERHYGHEDPEAGEAMIERVFGARRTSLTKQPQRRARRRRVGSVSVRASKTAS